MKTTKLGILFTGLSLIASATGFASITVTNCGSQTEQDIRKTLSNIRANQDDYIDFIEDETGYNMKSTFENLLSNGKVECQNDGDCSKAGVAGYAIPGNNTIHLCKENYIKDLKDNFSAAQDRRACFANLIAHEFAHVGFRNETHADEIGDASSQWWINNHTTTEVTRVSDCGLINEP